MPTDSPESDSPPTKRLKAQPESIRNTCAICFSDDGTATRGEIDSCDHYFCFICIVEWSKTESRCPLCRRRFASVRRSDRGGACSSTRRRVVTVPVRDQVSENFDPYADALCNLCHKAGDDSLLLLCDQCDGGFHTYCVGFGSRVPEGDWFCADCSFSRAERASAEEETAQVLLSELAAEKSTPRASENSNQASSGTEEKPKSNGARTLGRCRSVHGRIRAMRESWDAFRSGDLGFSSSSSFEPCQTAVVGFESYDTERAWKMMDMAKSKQSPKGKAPCIKASGSNERANVSQEEKKDERFHTFGKGIKASSSSCLTVCSPRSFEPFVSENVTSVRDNVHRKDWFTLAQENANRDSSIRNRTSDFITVPNEKIRLNKERSCDDDTKKEIQSLVKLNLKLLSRDKRLGADAFKEMARLSTHTILAACGLEHRNKYALHCGQISECTHIDEVSQKIPRSNLMPKSCQHCFESYVKNVVSFIMFEKRGSTKAS